MVSPAIHYFVISAVLSSLFCVNIYADVRLPSVFSDHAVLQKAARVPVWGTAESGENIDIALGTASASASAQRDGKWQAVLDLSQSGPGPFDLVIQGKNRLVVSDVLVGEVWICSGQSNMEWNVGGLIAGKEVAARSANSQLRQFLVPSIAKDTPQANTGGSWIIATPETTPKFSAVAYFYGKKLTDELGTPVGLIRSAWGGSTIEAWIPRDSFKTNQDLEEGATNANKALLEWGGNFEKFIFALKEWETKFGRSDSDKIVFPDESQWLPMGNNPGSEQPGVIWFRQVLTVPEWGAEGDATVVLSNVNGEDRVYWNGQQIGSKDIKAAAGSRDRKYSVSTDLRKPGQATLLVRVFNSQSAPSLRGKVLIGNTQIPEKWEYQVEKKMPLSVEAMAASPASPGIRISPTWGSASYLFNGMVAPLIPYAIRGAIWYQGEANESRGWQYRKAFPLLIEGWRKQWGQGDFPFYICQLANFYPKATKPAESNWADLRESQTLATQLSNVGQAVLIDLGESANIHPQQKEEVGLRLAKLALNRTYQHAQPDSGPVLESVRVEGDRIFLAFGSTDGGLVAKPLGETYRVDAIKNAPLVRNSPDSEIEGFAVCGEDRNWVWANACIEGNSVIVSSPQVPSPIAVRYDWADNPNGNLYNGAGLPAGPFRTDHFPTRSQPQRFGLQPKMPK